MYREFIDRRIFMSAAEAGTMLSRWRFLQKKIVFTNGCFDLLHAGHVDYLVKASQLGDMLAIGLNSDASVKGLKGANRPINDLKARALVLAALGMVDAVIIFDDETPTRLIEFVQPDVLVKGADYKPEEIAGYDIVKAKGGEVVTIDLLPGFSTSSIMERIAGKP